MALDKLLDIAIFLLQELAVLIYLLERQLVEHVALCYENGVVYHLCQYFFQHLLRYGIELGT